MAVSFNAMSCCTRSHKKAGTGAVQLHSAPPCVGLLFRRKHLENDHIAIRDHDELSAGLRAELDTPAGCHCSNLGIDNTRILLT